MTDPANGSGKQPRRKTHFLRKDAASPEEWEVRLQKQRAARAARKAAGAKERNYVKRKGDCTPAEWEALRQKARERAAKRRAEGREKPKSAEKKATDAEAFRRKYYAMKADESPEGIAAWKAMIAKTLEYRRRKTEEGDEEWLARRRATNRASDARNAEKKSARAKALRAQGVLKYRKDQLSREEWEHRLELQRRRLAARPKRPARKWQDQHQPNEPIKRLALKDETYAAIWKAIGPNHERDEIASEAYLALLEGAATDVKAAVTEGKLRHYRLFSRFHANLSMDEPHHSESKQTLHDIIAAYAAEGEPEGDGHSADPDMHLGDLGQILFAAYRRSEAVRQAA